MLAFLDQLVDSVLFIVKHIFEFITFIPRLLGMFVDSYGLIYASLGSAPNFLLPILVLILSVAVVMWLVNLL